MHPHLWSHWGIFPEVWLLPFGSLHAEVVFLQGDNVNILHYVCAVAKNDLDGCFFYYKALFRHYPVFLSLSETSSDQNWNEVVITSRSHVCLNISENCSTAVLAFKPLDCVPEYGLV